MNIMVLKVNGIEYRLKFGYRVLAKTELLKEVAEMQDLFSAEDNQTEVMKNLPKLIDLNSRLVLAGLQKYNEDFKVNYDDNNSVNAVLDKVYDFMDDYMDDPESKPVIDLFGDMVGELIDNGFLSKKSLKLEQAATEQDATVIPLDHQSKKN